MLARKRLALTAAFAVFLALGVAAASLDRMETTAGTTDDTTVVQDALRP
jgi:hypothetical protein